MRRDFTYVDDVIESLVKILKKPPIFNTKFNRKSPHPIQAGLHSKYSILEIQILQFNGLH